MGGMPTIGERFADGEMEADDFEPAFLGELLENYHDGWLLSAETAKGFRPVGLALTFRSHHDPAKAPFSIIGDMIWFPWASARNRVEAAVKFVVEMRETMPLVEYAREEHVPFFEVLMKHGVVRRVGTSFNVYPGEQTAVFETIPR